MQEIANLSHLRTFVIFEVLEVMKGGKFLNFRLDTSDRNIFNTT